MVIIQIKMKKIFILVLLLFVTACGSNQVCINGSCVDVELADTPELRQQGLMNRAALPEDQGMLFILEEEKSPTFWMKDTLLPLDIIWINGNKEIVEITKNAQPCDNDCQIIKPLAKVKYVLEVNGGYTFRKDIMIGDKVNF